MIDEGEEEQIIVDDLLDDDDHMRVALRVLAHREAIVRAILGRFIARLVGMLEKDLGSGWHVEGGDDPLDRYWGIWLRKPAWDFRYAVSLQSQYYGGRGFILGVQNDLESGMKP